MEHSILKHPRSERKRKFWTREGKRWTVFPGTDTAVGPTKVTDNELGWKDSRPWAAGERFGTTQAKKNHPGSQRNWSRKRCSVLFGHNKERGYFRVLWNVQGKVFCAPHLTCPHWHPLNSKAHSSGRVLEDMQELVRRLVTGPRQLDLRVLLIACWKSLRSSAKTPAS